VAPLIQVAWADDNVEDRERAVVLELAAARGIVAGTAPHAQVLAWLDERPRPELFNAAIEVIRAGFAVFPAAERADRIRAVLDACERVGGVAGGVAMFGLRSGAASAKTAVLDMLRMKLDALTPPQLS